MATRETNGATDATTPRALARGVASCWLSGILSLALATSLGAQMAGDASSTPAEEGSGAAVHSHAHAPVVLATRIAAAVVIDGQLDEELWARGTPVTSFVQTDPSDGAAASERTEVRIVFDDDALYVGARLWDASGRVSRRLSRRDAMLVDSDWFRVSLDTYHDHRTSAVFRINPAGVRGDELAGDGSWDPVWEAAASIDADGWTAEMRIPFTQLRFTRADVQTWGIQLSRTIASKRETHVYAYTPKRDRGGVSRYGHLRGLEGIRSGRPIEVLPYIAGRAEYREIAQNGDVAFPNPYRDGSDFFSEIGADIKYRPTSNLTLDLTINPDFGQVEVDPAVVNLSANETRLDEKRPFFIEGANIFEFGGAQLLHSRRIGRRPQGSRPSHAVYADIPDATTILGAAKLTGRVGERWNVGLVNAVAAREVAPFVTPEGARAEAVVEPLSNYLVGRAERDFRGGASQIGAIATSVHRDVDDSTMAARLRSSAYTGGMDFRHEWANRSWVLSGSLAGSQIEGRPEVMVAAQRASQRYYQRPDATYLEVDSTARSMRGYMGRLSLRKESGLHWSGGMTLSATSPGFEINDVGFQQGSDRISGNINIEYEERVPGRTLRSWSVRASGDSRWNYGFDRLDHDVSLRFGATLLNYLSGNLSVRHGFAGLDDRFTRGGPLTIDRSNNSIDLGFNTDSRLPYTLRGGAGVDWGADNAHGFSVNLTAGMKPMQNWSVELGPRFSTSHSDAQWLTSRADETMTATFGRRYIYAPLDQTTLSLDTRLNVTFSPSLTLGLYAQPLLASGSYGGPKALRAPRTFAFDRYGTELGTITRDEAGDWLVDPDGEGAQQAFSLVDPDFNRRSLRGSAALRWEWRPGSSLYLVWRQERAESINDDRFLFRRDAQALFRVHPENVFMVKASYWISP